MSDRATENDNHSNFMEHQSYENRGRIIALETQQDQIFTALGDIKKDQKSIMEEVRSMNTANTKTKSFWAGVSAVVGVISSAATGLIMVLEDKVFS